MRRKMLARSPITHRATSISDCATGQEFYRCAIGPFTGCCSTNPCDTGMCGDDDCGDQPSTSRNIAASTVAYGGLPPMSDSVSSTIFHTSESMSRGMSTYVGSSSHSAATLMGFSNTTTNNASAHATGPPHAHSVSSGAIAAIASVAIAGLLALLMFLCYCCRKRSKYCMYIKRGNKVQVKVSEQQQTEQEKRGQK